VSTHSSRTLLRFVQIGDLHLTERGQQNHRDLIEIVGQLDRHVRGSVDFIYLPGDNADDGTNRQFELVRSELSELRIPWRAIPGDHDFKQRSLEEFYRGLHVPQLPQAEEIGGCVCLFVDVVSQGTGGPDFKLGAEQFGWLKDRLAEAQHARKPCAVFTHAYPADLGDEGPAVSELLDTSTTRLVAMGHTHYNELTHDGRTVYAATRSTGQIEEGPVGFSFAALDGDIVSWRFKLLDSPWPFAMITSPADRRLALDDARPASELVIKACAWGDTPFSGAEFRIDGGPWRPMIIEDHGIFTAPLVAETQAFRLEVRITDESGATANDIIECSEEGVRRTSTGSDAGSVGAWPERHLFGTQLGPNRNGRKW
jgi:3',5'-cyclic-AMP phosphodiesterase